jgi:HlyD family secretion protein
MPGETALFRDTSQQDRIIAPPVASPRRWIARAGIAVGVLAVLALFVPGMARWFSASASVSSERLRIAEVRRDTLLRDVAAQARIVAARSPTLYAQAAGTVSFAVQAGQTVAQGDLLATVDSPELTSELQREQATLASLEADAEQQQIDNRRAQLTKARELETARVALRAAEREKQRADRAWALGAISEVDHLRAGDALENARNAFGQAEQDIALDRDALALALASRRKAAERQRLLAADLARKVEALAIRAPVPGMVGNLLVAERAQVAANAPLLTVVDLTELEVEVPVPEVYANDILAGMSAEVVIGSARLAGEVRAISPEVVEGNVNVRVRFRDGTPADLRQNQRAQARILIEERPDTLLVERGPFVDVGGGRFAWRVEGDRLVRVPIELGALAAGQVEILSGLEPGQRIVISDTTEFVEQEEVYLTR